MGYTTNLALPYPADTDFVGDGYLAIQNLADVVDGYFGASTSYTPTTTNVTGGTKAGQYNLVGHWLDFWVQISGTATATAAGSITISLPAGLIASSAGYVQPVNAMRGSNVSAAYVLSSADSVTVFADATGANFTLGQSVVTLRVSGRIEVIP